VPVVKLSSRVRGVLVALVGVGLLLVAAWQMKSAWRINNGREAEGRVVARDESAGQVRVRFPGLRLTQERAFDVSSERLAKLPRGTKVGVVVVAEGEAYLQGTGPTASLVIVPLLVGVVVVGLGVVGAVREPD
jgi:hypothetical protein